MKLNLKQTVSRAKGSWSGLRFKVAFVTLALLALGLFLGSSIPVTGSPSVEAKANPCAAQQAQEKFGAKWKLIGDSCKKICNSKEIRPAKDSTECVCKKDHERASAELKERRCVKSKSQPTSNDYISPQEEAEAIQSLGFDSGNNAGLLEAQASLPDDLQPHTSQTTPWQAQNPSGPTATAAGTRYTSRAPASWKRAAKISKRVALDFWGPITNRQLCGGSSTTKQVRILYGNIRDPNTHAWTWRNGNAKSPRHNCTIFFDRGYLDRSEHANKALLIINMCNTMVHEYGHLYGYQHTNNRNDIMHKKRVAELRRCGKAAGF